MSKEISKERKKVRKKERNERKEERKKEWKCLFRLSSFFRFFCEFKIKLTENSTQSSRDTHFKTFYGHNWTDVDVS
jgi:hypothetical protein